MVAGLRILHKHRLYEPSALYYLGKMQCYGRLPKLWAMLRGDRGSFGASGRCLHRRAAAGTLSFCAGDFPASPALQV
jgi:hypothetical protein